MCSLLQVWSKRRIFYEKCNIHEAELRLSVAHDEMIGEPIKSGSEAEQTMPLKFKDLPFYGILMCEFKV